MLFTVDELYKSLAYLLSLVVINSCIVTVCQSGQANAAAGALAGDHAAIRLTSMAATGGRGPGGMQSTTPGVSRATPGGDSAAAVAAAHDYATRTHTDGPTDLHVNSRITADHTAAANCMSYSLANVTYVQCATVAYLPYGAVIV